MQRIWRQATALHVVNLIGRKSVVGRSILSRTATSTRTLKSFSRHYSEALARHSDDAHESEAESPTSIPEASQDEPGDGAQGVVSDGQKPKVVPSETFALWQDYSDRLDPMILGTMEKTFRYKTMTKVQQAIIEQMPIEKDLLVRSKTGTGKTLAFLIPALQRALDHFKSKDLSGHALKTYAQRNASVLIISPTRELANQIATEARRLVTLPGSNMKALCVVGGDSKRDQLKLMRRERNDFVVGTPGRMLDLLQTVPEFAEMIQGVQTLILDEADTLLEMGFRDELQKIIRHVPKERQTLMFSATVSRDIQNISHQFLKPGHQFLNTVSKDDQDVHKRIKQEYIVRPAHEHFQVVLSLIITEQLKNPASKVIVFLPTTKMTMLYASAFKVLRRLYPNTAFQQFDIHSQRTQDSRTKVSQAFRSAAAGSVLFTSDVSARGVDYPGVSLVVQVGAAGSRDLYVHRVGRTGRAGLSGESIVILQPFETEFLRTLGKDIPITEKDFPDSEIALGTPQKNVFKLMMTTMPRPLVEETFISLAGAFIPRAREFRQDKREMLADLEAWYVALVGENHPVPRVSQQLMGSGGGGGRRSGGGGGGRRGGFDRQDRGKFKHSKFELDEKSHTEWRPKRPSEWTKDGGRRTDFNRTIHEQSQYADTGPYKFTSRRRPAYSR